MIPGIVAASSLGSFQEWSPADLATPPKIWLDDQSPITEVSGACSQWDDRSGGGWHFLQASATSRPAVIPGELNGRRVLGFDGVNDFMGVANFNGFQNVEKAGVFAVYKKRAADGSAIERPLVIFGNNAMATRAGLFAARGTANTPQFGGRRLDGDSFSLVSAGSALAGAYVMALGFLDYQARTVSLWIDGDAPVVTSNAFNGSGNSSNTIGLVNRIGADLASTPSLYGDIDMAALLALNELSSDEIDKLFGWASHRYGLTDNLPVGHPYKLAPP